MLAPLLNCTILFLLLALPAACGQPPAPQEADSEPAALAQGSAYPPDYAAMREAAAEVARGYTHSAVTVLQSPAPDGTLPTFDIMDCPSYDEEPGDIAPADDELENLARQVAILDAALRAQGYRPELFAEPLARYEQAALALIRTSTITEIGTPQRDTFDGELEALLRALGAELEDRRARMQPESLPIIVEGGCGLSEAPTLVKADPPDGRVWIITRFAFDVCKAKKLDAWQVDGCRWTEMSPDREAWLSGNYMVQARWPDGRTHRGSHRLERSVESETAIPFTVRPG